MPASCPPGAAVTVQALDDETYLVRLAKPTKDFKLVLIPVLDKLPDDPDWERKELDAAAALTGHLPCPDA